MPTTAAPRPTAVGLHAFAGLMTLGIKWAGFDVKACLEEGNFGQRTHQLNHPEVPIWYDRSSWPIEELQEMQVDLAYCQAACAGLSTCNVVSRGLDNPKMSGLMNSHAAAKLIRPRAYVVESVCNLFKEGDPLVSQWEQEWADLGYQTTRLLENALHCGLPQRRKRALFIAARDCNLDFSYGEGDLPHLTVADAIGDLQDQPFGAEAAPYATEATTDLQRSYRDGTDGTVTWHLPQRLPECLQRLLPFYLPGLSTNNLAEEVFVEHYRPYRKTVNVPDGRPSTMLRRAVWDEESPTLCGGPRIFHPDDHRLFTVRETARLMGCPDDWQLAGTNVADAYACLGKAVSPVVAKWVALQIKSCLDDPEGRVHQTRVDLVDRHPAPGHSRARARNKLALMQAT
jgi:DNA (cytosine-5)-methyltransferase 1